MRPALTIIICLLLSDSLNAQELLFGNYEDQASNMLLLKSDSSYEFHGHRYNKTCWSKGTWTFRNDTLHLHIIPIYDSILVTQEFRLKYENLYSKLEKENFRRLSKDTIIDLLQARDIYYAEDKSNQQFQTTQPSILVYHKNRFYELDQFGEDKHWVQLANKRRLFNPQYKRK